MAAGGIMRIVILMSTYNGDKYIIEQLISILNQLPENGRVLIRDDGSSDRTVALIKSFNDSRVIIRQGENIGFSRSFLALMAEAPTDADMYMLSDQDDIWLPEKIARAWDHIKNWPSQPVLYCSRLQLVDADLRSIGLSAQYKSTPSFRKSLVENIATGCTMAFTGESLRLANIYNNSTQIDYHDWWLYIVSAAYGRVIFDPVASIKYRQHEYNAIGMNARNLFPVQLMPQKKWLELILKNVNEFRNSHYEYLTEEKKAIINEFHRSSRTRVVLSLLTSRHLHRQTRMGELVFRFHLMVELIRRQ
jgi:glycosyltransferase involved in cell wall biosynthesis